MKNTIKNIKYIITVLLFTASCQLSNDLMDPMNEYNTDPLISINSNTAAGSIYNNDRFTITCTPSESGLSVRYTIDGTDPSRTAGTVYTTPLTIDSPGYTAGPIQIRAVAYDSNRLSGIVSTTVILGDGTAAYPYEIATPAQLKNVSDRVNSSVDNTASFRQVADIDLSSFTATPGWVPIGNAALFIGIYDGSNYTISNLTINRPASNNQGLFGNVAGNAILRNIIISNADVTGNDNTGALAGYINGTGVNIFFCQVTGSVTATSVSSTNIGGLVGYNNAEISGSTAACAVTGLTSVNVGGFVGQNSGSSAQIYSNMATGEVKGGDYTGGFVGLNTSGGFIDTWNSARGDVTGGNYTGGFAGTNNLTGVISQHNDARGVVIGADNTGGFVGYNSSTIGTDNYATGDVSGANYVGGFIGDLDSISVLTCYSLGNVTATGSSVGGFAGRATSSNITDCYSKGNIVLNGALTVNSSGGFIGQMASSGYTLLRCFSRGNITNNNANYASVGGFAGKSAGNITNCYSTGAVQSAGMYNGGFYGTKTDGTTTNCYSTGNVSGTGSLFGGFTGDDPLGIAYVSCYWLQDGPINSGLNDEGNSVITLTNVDARLQVNMYMSGTYTLWDFATIWNIVPNSTYPYMIYETSDYPY